MARIFISYSRIDEEFARRLAGSLSDAGADIWLDVEDIPAGMNWSTAIQQGLDSCDVMLVIISPESMASINVENEWQYALDEAKPIIPILWRTARVHFQLRRIQYIDFANQNYGKAFPKLARELQSKGIVLAIASPQDTSFQVSTQDPEATPSIPPAMPVKPESETEHILMDFPARRSRTAAIASILLIVVVVILAGIILRSQGLHTPVDEGTVTTIAQIPNNPTDAQADAATANSTPTPTIVPTRITLATVTSSVPMATFTTGVNVRRGPNVLFEPPIGSFAASDTAEVLAVNPERTWYKVRYFSTEGWVFANLLTISGNVVNLPVDMGPPTPTLAPPTLSRQNTATPTRTSQLTALLGASGVAAGNFEYGGHVTNTASERATQAMRRAGMSWMKVQVRYSPGMGAASVSGIIGDAKARDFKVLIAVVGNPGDLDAGGTGYMDQFASFLRGVASQGPDAIEVWNEPNIDREWPRGQISGAMYADLLRRAYQAIKGANGGVMVISGAPAPTGAESAFPGQVLNDDNWIRQMVEAGGLQYVDCVGAHYNEGIVAPSARNGDPRDGYYTRYFYGMLDTYWSLIGGQKPICFTELGYLTSAGYGPLPSFFGWAQNVTLDQHATWLAEAMTLASQSGKVRLVIVWNVDFTVYSGDPQAGYAMIRADGSCPACDAMANSGG